MNNGIKFSTQEAKVDIQVSVKALNDSTSDKTETSDMFSQTDTHSDDMREMELLFTIKDNGIGIPRDKFTHIFNTFSQLDSSVTRKYNGAGLGLPITKRLIEAMKGRIWLESKVGVGTTFYFTIVVRCSGNEAVPSPNNERTSFSVAPKQLKILVAEDNLINQKVIHKILDQLSCTPTIVKNGLEAVNQVEANDYDLIFMDLLMPIMGGLEATRIISGLDWSRHKKPAIVAMTASISEWDKELCYQAGMDYHISKPIDSDQVKMVIHCLQANSNLHAIEKKNLIAKGCKKGSVI